MRVLEVDERGKISLDRIDKPEAPAGSGNGAERASVASAPIVPSLNRSERSDRPRRAPGDNGGAPRAAIMRVNPRLPNRSTDSLLLSTWPHWFRRA